MQNILRGGLFWVFLLGFLTSLNAQMPDSVARRQYFSDTLTAKKRAENLDSLNFDVVYAKGALESKVEYEAQDSIIFDNDSSLVHLYGNAKVKYENLNLSAAYIVVDMKNSIATALPMPDSAGILRGLPNFKDGQQDFTAKRMRYNFQSQKGMVYEVVTKQNDMFIHSAKSKFVSKNPKDTTASDIAYGTGAMFSTCSADHPHFGIASKKQKVIPNKLIVVGPSNLVLGDVPTPLWLPFAAFPLKSGKSTGLIFPRNYTYQAAFGGYGLQDVGWYFPLGEHANLKLLGQVYWGGTWGLKADMDYVKKYKHSGSLIVETFRQVTETAKAEKFVKPTYRVNWRHQQDSRANPNFNFGGSVNLDFGGLNRRAYNDFKSATTTQYGSNISFTKSFPGKPFSLSGSSQMSQNVLTGDMNVTLPSLSFQMQQIFPFKRKELVGDERWYEKINLTYNAQMQNTVSTKDSLLFKKQTLENLRSGVIHNLSSGASFNLLKYFQFNTGVNYSEYWFARQATQNFDATRNTYRDYWEYNTTRTDSIFRRDTLTYGTVDTAKTYGFYRRNSMSVSASLSTFLFGTIQFKHGALRGLRHQMQPSMSIGYTPNYVRYADSVRYDSRNPLLLRGYNRFENAPYGSPNAGRPALLASYNITNKFTAKLFSKKDSTFKKTNILENLNINGNYNFIADSFRWSTVSMSTGTNFFKGLTNMNVRALFDPYAYDAKGVRVKQFAYQQNGKLLNLRTADISLSTALSVKQIADIFTGKLKDPNAEPDKNKPKEETLVSLFERFTFRHQFGVVYQKIGATDTFTIQNTLYTEGEIPISKKWRLTIAQVGYDFTTKKMTYPDIGVYRDLHCWEMGMNWQPLRNTYAFYLRVKPGTLDFLKIPYNKFRSVN